MSIYKITHSCGHTVEHQIYGTNVHGEREKKAAWLESRLCYDCYKKAQEDAVPAVPDVGYVALEGTEKQIAWAEDIRAKVAPLIAGGQEKANAASHRNPAVAVAMNAVLQELREQPSAKWWIEHRDIIDFSWMSKQAKEKMQ